jgi:exopolysaccharide biosynthesis polyprenyl glycosylphosphotransferase
MKKLDLVLLFLLLPFDFLAIFLAGFLAYFLRFESFLKDWRPAVEIIPFKEYLGLLILVAFVWLAIFALAGLYNPRPKKFFDEFIKIFFAASTGAIFVIAAIFFRREFFASRFIILAGYFLSIFFAAFFRFIISRVRHWLYRKGYGVKNVLVVGEGRLVEIIKNEFNENSHFGYRIKEVLPHFNEARVNELMNGTELDEIILVGQRFSPEELKYIIEYASRTHLGVKYASDILGGQLFRIQPLTLAGIPFVEVKTTPLDGWGKIYKRIFDISASFFLIIILLPVFAIAALVVLFSSWGPIIYKNERVGERNKPFNVFKFRSMRPEFCIGKGFPNSEEALKLERRLIEERSVKKGPVYKIADDPRVTPVGRWFRRYSVDELPQLLNVLVGNMSLVGPRPHQPREVGQYRPNEKKILTIRPGVTGLSQISGRSDLSFEEEAKLDIYYIENWSPLLDLYVLLKTPGVVFERRGAY